MQRRNFLLGLTGALAAPAIVRAESLMKIASLRRQFTQMELDQVMLDLGNGAGMEYNPAWGLATHWTRIYFDKDTQRVVQEVVPREHVYNHELVFA